MYKGIYIASGDWTNYNNTSRIRTYSSNNKYNKISVTKTNHPVAITSLKGCQKNRWVCLFNWVIKYTYIGI